jgi:hypothetical protein
LLGTGGVVLEMGDGGRGGDGRRDMGQLSSGCIQRVISGRK